MIRGLLVTMAGEELRDRIAERIRRREARKSGLEKRIQRREGDAPYDIRVDDGLETLGELESEREQHRIAYRSSRCSAIT